ncbi:MAG: hypothetical protein R3F34_03905 [Planctomycetota bacterium]
MPPTAIRGRCRIVICFDVARSIDLALAGSALSAARRTTFHHKGGFPTQAGVAPPVRVSWRARPVEVDGVATDDEIEISLYDFGAIAITWTLPIADELEELVATSTSLYGNAELVAWSRSVAEEVLSAVGAAAERPRLLDLHEDYVVYELGAGDEPVDTLLERERERLARILRAEPLRLSRQEVDDALSSPVSYGERDVALVDWLSSILIGNDTDDERLLLELATVELLELHVLDAQLDRETEAAYRLLTTRRGPFASWTTQRRELAAIARAQADDALLHEGIDNALKLFGDDYLARLYRVAGQRFHFDDFDRSIQRKLGVLRSVYESLSDQASHRRSEVLEWIIIVLIAVEILLYFEPWT